MPSLYSVLKSLDKSCMMPLRKAYCHSLNMIIRREVEFYEYFFVFNFLFNTES